MSLGIDSGIDASRTMHFNGQKLEGDSVYRLFRIRKTVFEMLYDRGYIVNQDMLNDDETEISKAMDAFVAEFNDKSNVDLLIRTAKVANEREEIFVFFPSSTQEKVGIDVVKKIQKQMEDAEVPRGIVILQNKFSGFALTEIQKWANLRTETTKIPHIMEHFLDTEMLVNITKHSLVPKHKILNDEEKETLLRRYHLRPSQLPRMQNKDPIARYYGLQADAVVKIVRHSETAGLYVSYRIVTR